MDDQLTGPNWVSVKRRLLCDSSLLHPVTVHSAPKVS